MWRRISPNIEFVGVRRLNALRTCNICETSTLRRSRSAAPATVSVVCMRAKKRHELSRSRLISNARVESFLGFFVRLCHVFIASCRMAECVSREQGFLVVPFAPPIAADALPVSALTATVRAAGDAASARRNTAPPHPSAACATRRRRRRSPHRAARREETRGGEGAASPHRRAAAGRGEPRSDG